MVSQYLGESNYLYNKYKDFFRALILFDIQDRVPGGFLSLPGTSFALENSIYDMGWDVACYEQDMTVYRHVKQTKLSDNPRKIIYTHDFIHTTKDIYDYAWFDFCGPLTENSVQSLDVRFNTGSPVIFTFLGSREKMIKNIIDISDRQNAYLDVLAHKNFYTKDIYIYEKTHGQTMMVFYTTYGIPYKKIINIFKLNIS